MRRCWRLLALGAATFGAFAGILIAALATYAVGFVMGGERLQRRTGRRLGRGVLAVTAVRLATGTAAATVPGGEAPAALSPTDAPSYAVIAAALLVLAGATLVVRRLPERRWKAR